MQRRDLLKVMASGAFASLAGCSAPSTGSSRTDLAWLDAISQADLVASGTLEAVDLVLAAAERLASVNSKLNAVTFKDIDRAVDAAPAAKGLLGGVPTLLKDLNSYPDMPWTRGSRLFAEALGEPVSAYTQRLLDAGLVVLGKTNTPEFGLLPTTEPLLHGPTRNPWNLNHSAGGSSGGAAAAVAAGIVPFAQCGDGGGSIRIPAALCGVFGLKPSRGRFPDQGYGEQAWPISIRHVISRTVRDSALVLALTERSDDSELLPVGFVEPSRVRPKRIALTIDSFYGPPDDETRAAVEATATRLAARGHAVEPVVDTPLTDGRFAEDFLTLWQATAGSIAALVQQKTNMP
ncbi:MAG: amidase family protein, partial [Pseudomonadota bacterium]